MPKALSSSLLKEITLKTFTGPLRRILEKMLPLESRGNKPLVLTFEQQLSALILFHLEEHSSGQELLQFIEDDDAARAIIGAPDGLKASTFYEAINTRGLEQMIHVFNELQSIAVETLPAKHKELGKIVAIDGSLINATLTMDWAKYQGDIKKAKAHVAFDLNHSIPRKIHLTDGKSDERPHVFDFIDPGETSVTDRLYQCYRHFDQLQKEGKHFVCRIMEKSRKTILQKNELDPESPAFYDAKVLLGNEYTNQTEFPVRVIGYKIDGKTYWVASSRFDLTAEQIMTIYKLRWNIESFFKWWKQHLKVYHHLARSPYGMLVQLFAGLITYLLLAIYCREEFDESVSIKRVRNLRNSIRTESRHPDFDHSEFSFFGSHEKKHPYANS